MMPIHPAAELFPEMTEAEFAELVEDIRANGLHDPIVTTPQREILDGRHRYQACMDLGIDPQFRRYEGEPWRYVISTNLHRRHLTDTQRARIAAKMANRLRGRPKKNPSDDGVSGPPSQAQAREMFQVSESSVTRARAVENSGTDSLKSAVDSGVVTLSAGAALAKTAPEEQDAAVIEMSQHRKAEPTSTEDAPEAKPEPKPRQRPRKPLGQAATEAGWNIRKAADKARKVVDDERFGENKDQVTRALRGHLVHVVETANALLATLPVIDQDTGELSE